MIASVRGKVLCLGDHVDTDQIYPSRYIEITDDSQMAKHALEGIEPTLPGQLSRYSLLLGGSNFGCGSSREHAVRSLKAAGIKILIAESFARIFFRNAINLGLPAIHLPSTHGIETDHTLSVDLAKGRLMDETTGSILVFDGFSGFVADILSAGGLVEFYKQAEEVTELS